MHCYHLMCETKMTRYKGNLIHLPISQKVQVVLSICVPHQYNNLVGLYEK